MLKIVPVFKKGMQQHILSDKEQDELSTKDFNDNQISRFLAKRFAAKEALSKASQPNTSPHSSDRLAEEQQLIGLMTV